MCCSSDPALVLGAEVAEMLARYRRLLGERAWDWGDERVPLFDAARWSRHVGVSRLFPDPATVASALRRVAEGPPAPGVMVVRLEPGATTILSGPARAAIAGSVVTLDVLVTSGLPGSCEVVVGEAPLLVPAGDVAITSVAVPGDTGRFAVTVDGVTQWCDDAVEPRPAGRLRLSSDACSRWSVIDETGGAWFPDGVLHKWDLRDRPYFHADDCLLDVPAGALTVTCARGLEFEPVMRVVHVHPGRETHLRCEPVRRFDPAGEEWYGADLHVHMNCSGDLVVAPDDAVRMQRGEGLHLVNLVAANGGTSLVYDLETLRDTVGRDLARSDVAVSVMGVEYRDDLLGHVHALGPSGLPSRFHAGHERSEDPDDWPPNAKACAELRALDATVGYTHPTWSPFPEDGSLDAFFAEPRSVEARELVVDAALGLVDSIDLLGPSDHEGAITLYHHLLSSGIRLAATAGTDVFLSFSRGPGAASNPPGWCRVYADLGGEPLSVAAVRAAIRAGRTLVTNGPWVRFTVDGAGPGSVLALVPGQTVEVAAEAVGTEVTDLSVVGADGTLARSADGRLRARLRIDQPGWLAAVARGPAGPATLDLTSVAHTSPVHLEIDGRRGTRRADAEWCLRFLDRLERLLVEHGRFAPETREERLAAYGALIERARNVYREAFALAHR